MASKFGWSWPPSACPNWICHGLQVRTITASKCLNTHTRLRTRCASPSSLAHNVGKRWSYKANSQSSSFRCTSLGIRREILRKSGPSSWSVGWGWVDNILPGRQDPSSCMDSWNLVKSKWDQKLGMIWCPIGCMIRWYEMRWDNVMAIYPGVSRIYT